MIWGEADIMEEVTKDRGDQLVVQRLGRRVNRCQAQQPYQHLAVQLVEGVVKGWRDIWRPGMRG